MTSASKLVSTEFPADTSGNLFPRRSTSGITVIIQRWPPCDVATAAGFYCEASPPDVGSMPGRRRSERKRWDFMGLCAACNIRHLLCGPTPDKVIARFRHSTKREVMERDGSCRPVRFSEVNDRTSPLHRRETQNCETTRRDLSCAHDVR